MSNPIYKRIRRELHRLRWEESDLQKNYLFSGDAGLPLMMVDVWATNDDLKLIASYLDILPSVLIALRGDGRETALAILDEIWDDFNPRLTISKGEAWEAIESASQFRGDHPARMKAEIALILDALSPSPSVRSECYFLDCQFQCVTKCRQTGRQPGA